MACETKIALSDKELALVTDAGWILTKISVIDKVYQLLGAQTDIIRTGFLESKPWYNEAITISPKISRGENYRQLPYVILDYPRLFSKDDVFAVRTMFWWANFFSISLHVSGKYKKWVEEKILAEPDHRSENVFICVHDNPWEHHFGNDNFVSLHTLSQSGKIDLINRLPFIKLAVMYDLGEWNSMNDLLAAGYKRLAAFLD